MALEPTPPKGSRVNKRYNRPFYETLRKTSAEIVNEARSSLRTLDTKRPFTPAEPNRTLFTGLGRQESRPPSSCGALSLRYVDSRPPSGTKLSPIESKEAAVQKKSGFKNRPTIRAKLSQEKLVLKNGREHKSNSVPSVNISKPTVDILRLDSLERVNSGPKERTQNLELESLRQRSNSYGDLRDNNDNKIVDDKEKSKYFEDYIQPLLRQMELNNLHDDEDSLIVNFDILWKTLEIGNMLGKSQLSGKKRSELLSSVYKVTSGENGVLLLKLTKLFLTLEVSGKNLELACKLMMKVSQDTHNDELFIQEGLIELLFDLLRQPEDLDMTNCLVYLTGAIKFLTANETVLNEIVKYNVFSPISLLLQYTYNDFTDDAVKNKESCNMLIQMVQALINFAGVDIMTEKFISYGILQQVLDLTETRFHDSDYFLTVSRLVSKLSMSEAVCHEISSSTFNYKILFDALKYNYRRAIITVRICYAFGNIANYCVDLREYIAFEYDGINTILEIADYYLSQLKELKKSTKEVEDVLVKAIRIIANLSIDRTCGTEFSNDRNVTKLLCQIIDLHEGKNMSDELLISCATTLNNLSFYAEDNSTLMKSQEQFSLGMVDMLLSENINCVIEALRVLGNFTRLKLVRDILMNEEVFDVIMNILDSNQPDVVFCTCGILINIMLDETNRLQFKKFHGISKLINILKEFAETDWVLAGLVCQILWNYCEKMVKAADCFGANEADDLITILTELIEPELALDYESQEDLDKYTRDMLKEAWSTQFQPVASLLLRKIDSHHSELVPIITYPE